MTDTIEVRDLRVSGKHGASEPERQSPQELDVSVRLDLDLSLAGKTDNLDDTLDYREIRRCVASVVEQQSFCLLERLATEILDHLMKNELVKAGAVSICKPGRLSGASPVVTMRKQRA
jgi:dihydroneopterin aldolase